MLAGHSLLKLMLMFIWARWLDGGMAAMVAPVAPAFLLCVLSAVEFAVAVIQAYVRGCR